MTHLETSASEAHVRVSIVGVGDIGRGWATLCVAAGWPVSIYDHDGATLAEAPAEIERRARALVALEGADESHLTAGLGQMTVGRSLLQACREAQWVIEASCRR